MALFRLQEKSWQDVENYLTDDDRILIPIGSTEQHGAFAPLGCDTMTAVGLAEAASELTGVAVAPPLWFGWSPHHLVRPGTVSIRAEVLIELLYDMGESLAEHGFRNLVVINGHRIVNIPWMQIAAERIQRKLGLRVKLFDPAYMSREIVSQLGFGPLGHAEDIEISHLLHLRPELVDMDRATDNPVHSRELYHLDPSVCKDTLCYVPATKEDLRLVYEEHGDAHGGNATKATADKGRAYHDHLVKRLVQVLDQLGKVG